jgi:hypothetical protein
MLVQLKLKFTKTLEVILVLFSVFLAKEFYCMIKDKDSLVANPENLFIHVS